MRLLLIDISAWLFFHLSISLGLLLLPDAWLSENHWLHFLFKERRFEQDGRVWRRTFHVHNWKDRVPDGASLFKVGYRKKQLTGKDIQTLKTFIKETKRAELTHWMLMLPAPLFFLWNPDWAGWVMIFYALLANSPFIMIQRYNRIRLNKVRQLKEKKKKKKQ